MMVGMRERTKSLRRHVSGEILSSSGVGARKVLRICCTRKDGLGQFHRHIATPATTPPPTFPYRALQVMRNFSVHALYIFHETLSARESAERLRRAESVVEAERRIQAKGGAGGGRKRRGVVGDGGVVDVGVRRCMRPPVNRLRLDVPELYSDLDSRQVSQRMVLIWWRCWW